MMLQKFTVFCLFFFASFVVKAQMITGVWHGRIDRQNVEVKMVLEGDSITGTSYYYNSTKNYQRYSIKGYVDPSDNSVIWWDDQLLDDKNKGLALFRKKTGTSSKADFNCPGGGVMKLDGNVYHDDDQQKPDGDVHLQKIDNSVFKDEWDFVIDNFLAGTNDRDIIDSISHVTFRPDEEQPGTNQPVAVKTEEPVRKQIPVTTTPQKSEIKIQEKINPPTIEQKFTTREKILTKEIPVSGDSIELRFYDNAEIDGDSISLFLNNKLLFEHIRLTDRAYSIKIATSELQDTNELVMVAENLGSVPPNTSYMVAIAAGRRYDAQLASSEGSSAMIRLVKQQ